MKANIASLSNGLTLIILSLWGYLSSDTPSITALIPTFVGAIIILLNKGVKNENKVIAHIVVLLTLIILFGLIKPLLGAIDRGNSGAVVRILLMIMTTIVAIVAIVASCDRHKCQMIQNTLWGTRSGPHGVFR